MGRKKNPDVKKLPLGTIAGNFKILAHLEDEVQVECQKCHLRSYVPYQNYYSRVGCSCAVAKDPFVATHEERSTLNNITDRYLKERDRYIPEHLRPYWKPREISPRWHPDNPDRYRNFIEDVGHKKRGQAYGFLDPCGDFTPENFYWMNARQDHQGTNQRTSRSRESREGGCKVKSPRAQRKINQDKERIAEQLRDQDDLGDYPRAC